MPRIILVSVLFGLLISGPAYALEPPPPLVHIWESSGPGIIEHSKAAASDRNGHVYVASEGAYLVIKFTSSGAYDTSWGENGGAPGEFECIRGIAVDAAGDVYVTDDCDDRVQKFSGSGAFITEWGSTGGGNGQFRSARAVAVQNDGTILVVDSSNDRVQHFSSGGAFIDAFGTAGAGPGQFDQPSEVAVDDSSNIYVADENNHRIQKFTSAGVFITEWGSFGALDGQFNEPQGIAVDDRGRVLVADRRNHRIQMFSRTGEFLAKWGSQGSGNLEFFHPWGVAVDDSGHVYVSDSNNHRVQKFSSWDRDGDGLFDVWETHGIDADTNFVADYVLPDADPRHKDLYIEVDAMTGLAPQQAALDAVVAAFAASPVTNPDGMTGIDMHIPGTGCDPCADETNITPAPWPIAWAGFDTVKAARFGTAAERAAPGWTVASRAKAEAFRYCVFSQSYNSGTSSGLAEDFGCNDFFVSMAAFQPTTADEEAGTFMHELGHALGLRHGGVDHIHRKPNYYSVMNYTWQMPSRNGLTGVSGSALATFRNSWKLDYSRSTLPAITEPSMLEATGLGGDASVWAPVGPAIGASPNVQLVKMDGPIDWNRDGDALDSGVGVDANYLPPASPPSPGDTLSGADDWSNLLYRPVTGPAWSDFRRPPSEIEDMMPSITGTNPLGEMTYAEFEAMSTLRFDCNGNGIFDDEEIDGGSLTDGNGNGIPDECEATTVSVGPVENFDGLRLATRGNPSVAGGEQIIAFNVGRAGRVTVRVFDVSGARVATLTDGSRSVGPHEVVWSGRDAAGRRVAAGVYFAEVSVGDAKAVAKLVRLR